MKAATHAGMRALWPGARQQIIPGSVFRAAARRDGTAQVHRYS